MAIRFATNSAYDVTGMVSRYTGTAVTRDSAYTNEEIAVAAVDNGYTDALVLPSFEGAGMETCWLHFKMKWPNYSAGNTYTDGEFLRFEGGGNVLAYIDLSNGSAYSYLRVGDTLTQMAGMWDYGNSVYTLDILFHTDPITYEQTLSVYVGGVLLFTDTATTTATYALPTDKIVISMHDSTQISGTAYFSEIIVDDADSTIGKRVATLSPAADGALTEWDGTYAGLNEVGDGLAMGATADGQRQTWVPSAYGGATTGAVVAVTTSEYVIAGIDGPNQVTDFLRIAGTNYDAATPNDAPLNSVNSFRQVYSLNPDTGVAWTFADLASLEVGYLSSTAA